MTSSTQNHQHHHTTSAPPPTPSSTTTTAPSPSTDLLSRLLHRLPPSLSTTPTLLRRRSSLTTVISPPVIPYNDLKPTLPATLPSISKLGYFQLTNHPIPSQLAHSAKSDSVSIFNLDRHKKHQHFPKNWPLGFDDDDHDDIYDDVLFLDSSCSTESSDELCLSNLRDFTLEMEKIGLTVMEALLCSMGLRNPCVDDPASVCSLMWVSDGSAEKMIGSGKFYPYVVGLHYQILSGRCSLLWDSGSVYVEPQMDSILVTLGDIAQVWSNGKLNKVRGKPTQNMEEGNDISNISMSLLVTLPLESTVSALLPRSLIINDSDNDNNCESQNEDDHNEGKEETIFNSFTFEDYAWRAYYERVPLKDPLDRYRSSTKF